MLPAAPRTYGAYHKNHLIGLIPDKYSSRFSKSIGADLSPQTEITNGGSFRLKFRDVDLRPNDSDVVLEDSVKMVFQTRRTDPVIVRWTATAKNIDAVASGEFELQLEGALDPLDD